VRREGHGESGKSARRGQEKELGENLSFFLGRWNEGKEAAAAETKEMVRVETRIIFSFSRARSWGEGKGRGFEGSHYRNGQTIIGRVVIK